MKQDPVHKLESLGASTGIITCTSHSNTRGPACMLIRVHENRHPHTHTHTRVCTHTHMYTHTHTPISTHAYTHIHMHMHTLAHTRTLVCTCIDLMSGSAAKKCCLLLLLKTWFEKELTGLKEGLALGAPGICHLRARLSWRAACKLRKTCDCVRGMGCALC